MERTLLYHNYKLFSSSFNNRIDLYFTPSGCYDSSGVIHVVKNLRKLRLGMGLSQQQLADVIGTSQQSINKYENHNVEPDIAALIRLADYFGVSLDDLVGRAPAADRRLLEELELSREGAALVRDYRALSKEEKSSILLVLKNYLKNRQKPPEP